MCVWRTRAGQSFIAARGDIVRPGLSLGPNNHSHSRGHYANKQDNDPGRRESHSEDLSQGDAEVFQPIDTEHEINAKGDGPWG